MEIEEIKNLWKEQKTRDIEIKSTQYYTSLLDGLKKNEKKVKRNYIIMSIVMLFTIFFIDKVAVESMTDKTMLTWAGFWMIYLAIAAIIYVSWATVIKFDVKGLTESSLEFLKTAREKLRLRNRLRTIGIPVYTALLTIGITFVYIQVTAPMELIYKVITYTLFYLLMAIITVFSYKREKKKYLNEVKPIEDKLDTLLNEH
ncbi:MAG: hypothetical protein IAE93_08295 [Ignavibacteria bacterium]|nr:hypothetical protein [Ignavibacteria bacterium]